MGKKDIDSLFQEKFSDFHQIPDEKVWERLDASLNEKKKSRKVIPIWWKLAGTAAALALLFLVVNPFKTTVVDTDKTVVETEDEKQPKTNKDSKNKDFIVPETEVVTVPKSQKKSTNNAIKNQEKGVYASASNKNQQLKTKNALVPKKGKTLAENNSETQKINASNYKNDAKIAQNASNDAVTNSSKNELKDKTTTASIAENTTAKETVTLSKEEAKKSIFETIDDVAEKDALAENKSKKWSVGAAVAPVYFNSLDNGSSIHPNFVSNSKTGNVNMSYGLSVGYKLNKRLSIRSGVHKVDYGYDTNEVIFTSSFDPETNSLINTIDYDSNSDNVIIESKKRNNTLSGNDVELSAKSPSKEGKMVQQFGYVEIPLELNYTLLDRKFGVNLIGGLSSLFLTDNSVSLESGNLSTEIGASNTINNVNFSTNVGFGLNYKFTSKIQLNLEPVFKYQLNTFSDTSGNFQPFSMGVYSGLSFKF